MFLPSKIFTKPGYIWNRMVTKDVLHAVYLAILVWFSLWSLLQSMMTFGWWFGFWSHHPGCILAFSLWTIANFTAEDSVHKVLADTGMSMLSSGTWACIPGPSTKFPLFGEAHHTSVLCTIVILTLTFILLTLWPCQNTVNKSGLTSVISTQDTTQTQTNTTQTQVSQEI